MSSLITGKIPPAADASLYFQAVIVVPSWMSALTSDTWMGVGGGQSLQWADVLGNVGPLWWDHSHKIQHANKHNVPSMKILRKYHSSAMKWIIPWKACANPIHSISTHCAWHTGNYMNVVVRPQAERFLKCRCNPVLHLLRFNAGAGL